MAAKEKGDKPGPMHKGWTFERSNPDGIYSGMTKRLAISNGTFSPRGDAPKDKPAVKRER